MRHLLSLRPYKADDETLRTFLFTDASLVGMAGYVAQGEREKDWQDSWPIECWARAFAGAEVNYGTPAQERLALVQSLAHFEHFLRGMRFTVCTDHKALIHMATGKPATDWKLARWQMYIDTFDFDIIHIPGDQNLLADTLSRIWEH